MSTHMQFTLLALAALIATLPVMIFASVHRLAFRSLAITFYTSGFALIGAALVLDPVIHPPLFYHGFIPGIGMAMIALGLAIVLQSRRKGTN